MSARHPRRRDRHDPSTGHAVVLGDRDLGAPLHAAGVPVTAVVHPGAVSRFSRHYASWLPDPGADDDALAALLVEHARSSAGPAALFYQSDDHMLLVSRRRDELAEHLRFVIPDAELLEALVDKAAFAALAERLDLPVPPTRVLSVTAGPDEVAAVDVPVLVKPLRREDAWGDAVPGKAVLVEDHAALRALLDALAPGHGHVLAQRPVLGPETAIESYHAYVDQAGEVAAEFTGRKVRTLPAEFGHTSAVVTTDASDVTALGRDVLAKLQLRGVAKVDFKRDPAGRLWLLEVNPRFNLWHHVGAAAGVNIPAVVAADLLGLPRPAPSRARAGVTWCWVERDWRAARESGTGVLPWLRWVAACGARAGLDPADPLPVVAKAVSLVRDRLRTGRSRGPA